MNKKYVLIPLNGKTVDHLKADGTIGDKTIARYVLLRYMFSITKKNPITGVPSRYYYGTKLLAKDPYFSDKTKSHQYILDNNGFTVIDVKNEFKNDEKCIIDKKRRYHANKYVPYQVVEFTSKSDDEAIANYRKSGFYDEETKEAERLAAAKI